MLKLGKKLIFPETSDFKEGDTFILIGKKKKDTWDSIMVFINDFSKLEFDKQNEHIDYCFSKLKERYKDLVFNIKKKKEE